GRVCRDGKVCQTVDGAQVCGCPNGFECAQDGSCPCAAGSECYHTKALKASSPYRVRFEDDALECFAAGTQPERYQCSEPSQWLPGLDCVGGICRKPCTSDDQCPGTPIGRCKDFCMDQCNPAHPQETAGEFTACGPGLGCESLDDVVDA